MTKTEAIAEIQSHLSTLTDEQAQALAELAAAWARTPLTEDRETLAAIAEGLAQAEAGNILSSAEVDALLRKPWR